jgi:hypothetical protein
MYGIRSARCVLTKAGFGQSIEATALVCSP